MESAQNIAEELEGKKAEGGWVEFKKSRRTVNEWNRLTY